MLTKGDVRYVFHAFSFMSKWWSFPAKFNRSTGKFHVEDGGRRRKGFRIVLAIAIVHSMLMSGRTFEAGAISRNVPLEFLALGILASVTASGLCLMGILVHRTLETQVKLWSELIDRLDQSGKASPLGKKTLEELWICYMTFTIHPMSLTWPVAYWVKPDLPFYFYGNVPTMFKCTPALVVCCLIDVVITTFYAALSIYVLTFITAFGRQMRIELQSLKDKIMRFGMNPESTSTSKNVPEPLRLLEIEESALSETRVMESPKNEARRDEDKIEVVCEVKARKIGNAGRGSHWNEVKAKGQQNPGKTAARADIKRRVKQEAEEGIQKADEGFGRPGGSKICSEAKTREVAVDLEEFGEKREFRGDAKKPTKSPKRGILKGVEKWVVRKAEEWAVKKAETWAGKTIGKWAVKRSGKWAIKRSGRWTVKNEENWLVRTDNKWTEKTEEKLVDPRKEERVVINMEMERIKEANKETTESQELKAACTTLEGFRLFFRLFNHGFAETNFLLKITTITVSIWGMFATIRLANKHPEFAFFYLLMASVCFTCYIMMFNNAYHLSGLAEKCKALILLQSTTLLNRQQQSKDEWTEIRCRIAAIPRLAMYSGHFHAIERGSTPIFIHFILQKLADLLLAF